MEYRERVLTSSPPSLHGAWHILSGVRQSTLASIGLVFFFKPPACLLVDKRLFES